MTLLSRNFLVASFSLNTAEFLKQKPTNSLLSFKKHFKKYYLLLQNIKICQLSFAVKISSPLLLIVHQRAEPKARECWQKCHHHPIKQIPKNLLEKLTITFPLLKHIQINKYFNIKLSLIKKKSHVYITWFTKQFFIHKL